jgi:hypothetical protein
MRARFAFPMQGTGRGIAAAPESMPSTNDVAVPRARAGARALARPSGGAGRRTGPGRATRGRDAGVVCPAISA